MNVLEDRDAGPGQVHAIVVGTSFYPSADPGGDNPNAQSFGVEGLTSAARSASQFAAWLLNDYSRRDELASLRVLLSPSEGEQIDAAIAARLPPEGAPATLAAFKREFRKFQTACSFPESTAIVYLAGHGVQVSMRGATVLLQDYLADPDDDLLAASIDVIGCHAALDGQGFAQVQFWFVDACRQRSEAAKRFETLAPGWAPHDRPLGMARVSPVFLAASPREQAFAEIGGTSLFNQALAWILEGRHVANEPSALCDHWHVNTGLLINTLAPRVKELALHHEAEQLVDVTGNPNPGVLHTYDVIPLDRLVPPPETAEPAAGAGEPTAHITIRFALSSNRLGELMPWSVTTPTRLVAHGFGSDVVELPAGAYTVECALPDGSKLSQTVEVRSGDDQTVTFEHADAASPPFEPITRDLVPTRRRTRGQTRRRLPDGTDRGVPAHRPRIVTVTDAEHVVVGTGDGVSWAFQPAADLRDVPTADLVTASGREVRVSLPVNPTTGYPRNSCVVTSSDDADLQIRFAPERQVASALVVILEQDELGTSTNVFTGAADALLRKYDDPAGAALGGLTLHRLGRLTEREEWVENLAASFPWLPDGQILLAALLQHDADPKQRARGLAVLLSVATQRPLYTDGLALAVDLLRRWDDDPSAGPRREALGTLGAMLADADQSQIFLTTVRADGSS